MTEKKRTFKLDLFGKVLPALDKRDFGFYKKMTEEEQKAFADIVVLRWMSSADTNDRALLEYLILATNNANKHFWNSTFKDHKELKCMMLASAGEGRRCKHEYIKAPQGKARNTKVLDVLRRYYPTASADELEMFVDINDIDDLIEIGKIIGLQKDQLADYRKEVRKVKK